MPAPHLHKLLEQLKNEGADPQNPLLKLLKQRLESEQKEPQSPSQG